MRSPVLPVLLKNINFPMRFEKLFCPISITQEVIFFKYWKNGMDLNQEIIMVMIICSFLCRCLQQVKKQR